MANSRKRLSAERGRKSGTAEERVLGAARACLRGHALRGKRVAVGLSGGVDSVTLLEAMRALAAEFGCRVSAIHVHHGLSVNANAWSRFCRELCRRWNVPLTIRRVKVRRAGKGLEAAAREARYAAFRRLSVDAIALGHQLNDQAETVLMNLLRGAGLPGASGMPAAARLGAKLLLRPLLEVPREAIVRFAEAHRLQWIEDESNRDDALTRSFLRRRVAPLLAGRFPRWRESLARAARHFAAADADANRLLREFLAARGLRAPSERKLAEMLRQLSRARRDARVAIAHDGAVLRLYRDRVMLTQPQGAASLVPVRWSGEPRLALPELGGELRFRRRRGAGIDPARLPAGEMTVRLRAGGERLQPDPRRPRRALKKLFQEAGIPPWERERLPLLFCGSNLVWAPGLGMDARYRAAAGSRGIVPEWRPRGCAPT